MWLLVVGAVLLTQSCCFAEEGFDSKYERDYNVFNPINQYRPDNPLNPINSVDPKNPFSPINQFDRQSRESDQPLQFQQPLQSDQ
jgi:hypothetical protein